MGVIDDTGKKPHFVPTYFVSTNEPSSSLTEDDLDEFFLYDGLECGVVLSPLNGEEALASRIFGLARLYPESKVVVARIVHNRDYGDADIFSYAVLVPHGMNMVWEVFPILSHSNVSMPEALITPCLKTMNDEHRLDFRETRFQSENEFESWVKKRDDEFKALDDLPADEEQ